MTQNIYDTEVFFEGYSKMGRSVEGLAGAPEWPALQAMLPSMPGLKVVDLGCGYGWFSRWAQEQGAEQVLGLDVSQKMLARAKEMTSSSAITYGIADLEKTRPSGCRFRPGLQLIGVSLHRRSERPVRAHPSSVGPGRAVGVFHRTPDLHGASATGLAD